MANYKERIEAEYEAIERTFHLLWLRFQFKSSKIRGTYREYLRCIRTIQI